jgi:hypothetical protein
MPDGVSKIRTGVGFRSSAQGTLLRGVVIDVYRYDAEKGTPAHTSDARCMYADVLAYTSIPGNSVWRYLPRCLITQAHAGRHDGDIYVPRKNSEGFGTGDKPITPKVAKELDGKTVKPGTSPAMMDGDHVLVGFIDNAPNQPAIVGYIPHPHIDAGVAGPAVIGERLHMIEGDHNPRMVKHQGTYHGVASNGTFVVNTTRAHLGDQGGGTEDTGGGYGENGAEVANRALENGIARAGNMAIDLPPNAVLTFNFTDAAGDITNRLTFNGADGTLTVVADNVRLGSDTDAELAKAVLGEALNTWLTTVGGLSVQTAFGPSGPSVTALTGETIDPTATLANVLSAAVKVKE